ncbi:MAG: leucine-rich repeat domain-containing protein, partial [Clostridia bacterium]|nr:leucine-rich repeat domain-containing protein [Clostridia bacterium]
MRQYFLFGGIYEKKLTLISLFVLLLCIAFSACGKKNPASTDTSSETDTGAQHTHTEEILPGVAPTCTETGLTEGKKCSECGEILVEQAVLPVTHTEEIIPEVAPTCTETGLTEGKKCSLCGKILAEQATIAPTKHNYNGSYECTKCDFVIPVSEGLEFTLDAETDTYTVTGIGTCSDSNIVIPYTYKGKSVTRIGYEAFSRCYSLTSVSIPNSVTYIDDTAFFGCNSLKYNQFENAYYLGNEENPYLCLDKVGDKNITSCIINETTKIIQDNAFYGCSSLTSITIPNSVASIGNEAFYDCDSLTSIKIPNSVASIGDRAFYDCDSLTSVTIGNGVTKIGGDAFYDCSLITSVSISDIASWCNISFGDSFSNPLTYAQNLYLNGTLVTDLVIPSAVTEIKKYAFVNYDSLTSISIANSVTSIGYEAFYRCHGLTSVTIPDSVTSIDGYAFYGCMSLTSITIGNSVTSIGNHAFYDCKKLVEVYNLSSLKITTDSSSNGHVGYYAKVIHTSLNKPSILETVDDYIFMSWEGKYYLMGYVSNETELTLPESYNGNNYEIYGYAFYERDITKVTIPNSVTKIGDGAFYNCDSLTSITIPNSITEIGDRAFCDCSSLTSIAIGNSVTKIGVSAFEDCFSLKSVKINDIASWCNISFSGGDSNPLYHAHNLYLNGTLVTDIVIPSTVTKIKNSAFEDCTSLTS